MSTYSEKLKDPRWQRRRTEILNRDEFTCQKCYDTETELHVHHKEYNKGKMVHEYSDDQLVTLCAHCHFQIEAIKKSSPATEFENIKILKISNPHSDKRLMFVSYDEIFITKMYRADDLLGAFSFDPEVHAVVSAFHYNHSKELNTNPW